MREPKLVDYPQLTVVGMHFYGDPFETSAGWTEENEIGRLWKRFMAFYRTRGAEIAHARYADVMLEIHSWDDDTRVTGQFDVFVGVEVHTVTQIPVPLLVKLLPSTTYAVFTLEGDEITGDWTRSIYQGWLAEHGYCSAHPYMIQWYDPRFQGIENVTTSRFDVYIPVERQQPGINE